VFDWLFEGRLSVYLVLAAVGVVVAALWARSGFVVVSDQNTRGARGSEPSKRRLTPPAIALGVLLVLALGYFLLDRLVETRNEQIERKLQEMARAVKKGDVDRIFSHISEQFLFRGLDKARFRRFVEGVRNNGDVDEMAVWDIKFPDNSAKVEFRAKPTGNRLPAGGFQVIVHAEFVRDSDGQWRLKGFEVFNPIVESKTPLPIPQLP
jgi:hypothetical protein